ncbi:hypothetical protein [Microvirga makkahensis]|uniref:hypothetical protein n=1 Tax=Microvirga makkahensis TaxID=1128670 RepID=UPI0031B63929
MASALPPCSSIGSNGWAGTLSTSPPSSAAMPPTRPTGKKGGILALAVRAAMISAGEARS